MLVLNKVVDAKPRTWPSRLFNHVVTLQGNPFGNGTNQRFLGTNGIPIQFPLGFIHALRILQLPTISRTGGLTDFPSQRNSNNRKHCISSSPKRVSQSSHARGLTCCSLLFLSLVIPSTTRGPLARLRFLPSIRAPPLFTLPLATRRLENKPYLPRIQTSQQALRGTPVNLIVKSSIAFSYNVVVPRRRWLRSSKPSARWWISIELPNTGRLW